MSKRLFCMLSLCIIWLCIQSVSVFAWQAESLSDRISTIVVYTSDLFANTTGGFDTGIRYLDNLDLIIQADWDYLTLFAYGLANQGGNLSELSGDFQTASNIEAPNSFRWYEAWANIPIKPINSSLLIGLYDLNTEFDITNTGSLFINSSHGIGPEFAFSGRFSPSIFPYTSLAVRLKVNIVPGISLKGAVLDGVPSDPADPSGTKVRLRESDGSLMVGEIELFSPKVTAPTERNVVTDSPFRIIAGIWQYTEERQGWEGDLQIDAGVYAMAEAKVLDEKMDRAQGLSVFVRYGLTNSRISRFSRYFGSGLVYQGLFPNRDQDRIGLAVSLPMNSDEFVATLNQDLADELTTEFTYQFVAMEKWRLQIDAQYIANPNLAPGLEDAILLGLRSIIEF
ncbi:MAG: carbohydrate porin [bacterium]|nr:carbohydrate porin [bacterium]